MSSQPLDITQPDFLVKADRVKPPAPANYIACVIWFFIGLPILLCLLPVAVGTTLYKKFVLAPKKGEKKAEDDAAVAKKDVYPIYEATQRVAPEQRVWDLVMYGATGFTGNIATEYILEQYFFKTDNKSPVKVAFAGRSKVGVDAAIDKALKALTPQYSEELATAIKSQVGVIVADSADVEALRALVNSTRSIATTVGPYDKYGTPLLALCAAYGTHCANITGETDWYRNCIAKYQTQAKQTGAILTFHAGHDCIPHDECCRLAAAELKKMGEEVKKFTVYDYISGGMSGGTLSTVIHAMTGAATPVVNKEYDSLLTVDDDKKSAFNLTTIAQRFMTYDARAQAFVGPFVMADIMGKCVKRSNAVNQYGKDVTYHEMFKYNSFFQGFPVFMINMALAIALCLPYVPEFLAKKMPPGTGPSKETQMKSFLHVQCIAEGTKGSEVSSWCYINKDAGYYFTARMLIETALAPILNKEELPPSPGGTHTPATCLGPILQKRLAAIDIQFVTKVLSKK